MGTDVMDVLRTADLLGSASAADLEAIAAVSRLRTFRRGQILFAAGDPSNTLIVVVSGRVKVWVPRTSFSSRDQAIFADQATDASLPSDVVLLKIDRFG